jgi:hypothetical protein
VPIRCSGGGQDIGGVLVDGEVTLFGYQASSRRRSRE